MIITNIKTFEIEGLMFLETKAFGDERGYFEETFSKRDLAQIGIEFPELQANHSFSKAVDDGIDRGDGIGGIFRGFHFQKNPHAQAKLVGVMGTGDRSDGLVFDYAVDLRKGSQTFGEIQDVELKPHTWFYIPAGFAHAFIACKGPVHFTYFVSDYWAPDCECGFNPWKKNKSNLFHFEYPDFINPKKLILSEKDKAMGSFDDLRIEDLF